MGFKHGLWLERGTRSFSPQDPRVSGIPVEAQLLKLFVTSCRRRTAESRSLCGCSRVDGPLQTTDLAGPVAPVTGPVASRVAHKPKGRPFLAAALS